MMSSQLRRRHGLPAYGLWLGLLLILVWTGVCCRSPELVAPPPARPATPDVADLQTDIRLLDTLTGLKLTGEQIHKLVPVVTRLRDLRTEYGQRQSVVRARMRPLLMQERESMLRGEVLAPAQARQLSELEAEAARIDEQLARAQGRPLQELRALLTTNQVEAVTGRERAEAQAEELLTWFREMSAADYADEAVATAEALANPELGLDADMLRQLFTRTRNLSAAQYQVTQRELVGRLAPLYGATAEADRRAFLALFDDPRSLVVLQDLAARVG